MIILDDCKRLEYLLQTAELLPFHYTGDWLKDEALLFSSWKENIDLHQNRNE